MDEGFIIIPRSILKNPLYIDLPYTYKEVFLKILEIVVFKPQQFDDFGTIIDLEPGQVCISTRELANRCSKHVDKNIVERMLTKFFNMKFLRQEVRHVRMIITVTHPEICAFIKKATETVSETTSRQVRDRFETQKNKEKKDKKDKKLEQYISRDESRSNADCPIIYSSLQKDLSENSTQQNQNNQDQSETKLILIERKLNVHISEDDHQDLIKKHGIEMVDLAYSKLSIWKATAPRKKVGNYSDIGRVRAWALRDAKKSKLEEQELEIKAKELKVREERLKNPQNSTNFYQKQEVDRRTRNQDDSIEENRYNKW